MLQSLFETGFAPHGICLLWDPTLLWLHAASDLLIGLSYYVIPVGLAWLMVKRRDLVFGWMFGLFALFILACGTTHFMDVWVLWYPDYGVQGLLKAATAVVSVVSASLVWVVVPRLLAIPTAEQFRRVAHQLNEETNRHGDTIEQLRRSEQQFRLLLESVRDTAVFMLSPAGIVTSWNQGARNLKGYRGDEVIGSHFARFHTPPDREAGKPLAALKVAETEGVWHEEGWQVRKDGSLFRADVTIHPIHDRDSVLVGFSKVTRDITKRHQAEEDLEKTRAALAQSQKMQAVGQLTGGIAHDFNNMLTAVLGGIELLEVGREPLGGSASRVLQMIRRAAEHGAQLTTRLLAFSRKQSLMPGPTDLNRLVSEMSELFKRTLGSPISIAMKLSDDLWPAFVDANQLEAALLNLAVNARDAMPRGGTLVIETANTSLSQAEARRHNEVAAGDYVKLVVRDIGCGMPAEVLEHAFEPFYTTKGVGTGTGLGLSQVYGFVKQSGGHVELDSRVNEGTSVTLYLPRLPANQMSVLEPAAQTGTLLLGGSETVLIVEDDEDVRGFSSNAARHLGYKVLEASDADDARRLLHRHPDIRLLFTDVGLPGMNGSELGRAVRADHPGLKVVFTSGYAKGTLAELGLMERGVRLLPKPFRIETLAAMLRASLDEA